MIARLAEALEHGGGTHSLNDVLAQIEKGDAQLWQNEGGVIVTEMKDTPNKRVVHFWLAAGELESVVALSKDVLAWAKEKGCEQATLAGRRGWERVLASEGWAPMLTVMSRGV